MEGAIGFGKLNASLATFYNENSAALINNNFDFTLVKVAAPIEFEGLGSTISRRRKIEAEEGGLHRTARKLGALFGDVLSPTEDLFRIYGKRVSEISAMPSINPRENLSKEGVFASHIGADTASIWAAARSGSAAIAVHLLGCLLARVFTGPEAISVWVELVQRQKESIQTKQNNRLYPSEHDSAMSAAKQEISRMDLANWDASARAWLQSADQAMAFHHKRTMLIFNRLSIPVNSEPETYLSVIRAWTAALEAMNNLAMGMPQRVQDGATLLAISSWHLYPDLLVYGDSCQEVKQNDPLFNQAALLTLGLQHVRTDSKSVYWSLPLKHLQYYGHPIQASRTVGQENSRITCGEFSYVILGCLFNGWKKYAPTDDDGLHWIDTLAKILTLSTQHRFDHAKRPTWLIFVVAAAREYLDLEDTEKDFARKLMTLGRRFSTFLHPPAATPPPLFGLSQIQVLISVLRNDQERVTCLRQLCSHIKVDGSKYFIRYRASTQSGWSEYASVVPMQQVSRKRKLDGQLVDNTVVLSKHVRWIALDDKQLLLVGRRAEYFRDQEKAVEKLAKLVEEERLDRLRRSQAGERSGVNLHDMSVEAQIRTEHIADLRDVIALGQRRSGIESLGELYLPVLEYFQDPEQRYYGSEHRHFGTSLMFSKSLDFVQAALDLVEDRTHPHAKRAAIPLSFFLGDERQGALYSIERVNIQPGTDFIPGPTFLEEFLTAEKLNPERIYRHFESPHALVQNEIACLKACAMMAEVYHLLPGATISALFLKLSLSQAKWFNWVPDRTSTAAPGQTNSLTLAQAFACIAMFESGTCNLDPDTLGEAFAMASGNSLYVAGTLLCDPYEQPSSTEIRRVIGNVGRAGMTFLISPPEVKTREADPSKWMTINHREFDGELENHFDDTSLHLSFTDYEIPLVTEHTPRHTIDRPVMCVETLISVYERGTWVGEVDILKSFRSSIQRIPKATSHNEHCKSKEAMTAYQDLLPSMPELAATSVENWDELIEAPCTGSIVVRAHCNWLARLAATALCVNSGFLPVVLGHNVCWLCCAELIRTEEKRVAIIY